MSCMKLCENPVHVFLFCFIFHIGCHLVFLVFLHVLFSYLSVLFLIAGDLVWGWLECIFFVIYIKFYYGITFLFDHYKFESAKYLLLAHKNLRWFLLWKNYPSEIFLRDSYCQLFRKVHNLIIHLDMVS